GAKDIGHRRAVFALQPVELEQAVVDLLEAIGCEVNVMEIIPQKIREVFEGILHGAKLFEVCAEARVVATELLDPALDRAERRKDGTRFIIERAVGLARKLYDALGIREDLARPLELLVLARHGSDALDLGDLKAEDVERSKAFGL